MDMLAQLRSQAEQVEIIELHAETASVEYEANQLKTSKVQETSGVAMRVVRGGRLGFAASSDAHAPEKLAERALESAAFGDPVSFQFPGAQPAAPVATFDPVVADLSLARLAAMGQEMVEVLLAAEPEARVSLLLKRGVQKTALRNQAGANIKFQRSPLSLTIEVDRIAGDDVLILYEVRAMTRWEADYLACARELAEKLALARDIVPLTAGRWPVILAPASVLPLALALSEGLNGKNVQMGTSPLNGKLGETLLDTKLTIADDGTLDGRPASAPFDGEGVPCRRTILFERGVLRGFIYDLKTATEAGTTSTGNGGRELFTAPQPAFTNLVIEPGETSLSELIGGIHEGLLLNDLLGVGQGNLLSGAFSNPVALAFKIENGRIVGRVKNASIAGNVYTLLKDVAAISRETGWVMGTLSTPYLLIPDMNVVTQAGR